MNHIITIIITIEFIKESKISWELIIYDFFYEWMFAFLHINALHDLHKELFQFDRMSFLFKSWMYLSSSFPFDYLIRIVYEYCTRMYIIFNKQLHPSHKIAMSVVCTIENHKHTPKNWVKVIARSVFLRASPLSLYFDDATFCVCVSHMMTWPRMCASIRTLSNSTQKEIPRRMLMFRKLAIFGRNWVVHRPFWGQNYDTRGRRAVLKETLEVMCVCTLTIDTSFCPENRSGSRSVRGDTSHRHLPHMLHCAINCCG